MTTIGETIILGDSPAIKAVISRAARVAASDLPVLLLGETGTGKELFAQEIHRWSGRPARLVDVNCAALPREVAEGLLFGHRKGAFTGAIETSLGLIEDSNRGTLFLDEIASAPLEIQAKLLRVLETREVRRVGETTKRTIDLRVIAAAQDDLGARVAAGNIRNDLVQRLAGAVLHLPPLRERGGDIAFLATVFAGRRGRTLGSGTDFLLATYHWPGNVRELQAVIGRASLLTDDDMIGPAAIEEALELGASLEGGIEHEGRERLLEPTGSVRDRLLHACAAHDWNSDRIANALGLGRTTLFKHLRRHHVSLRKERCFIENRLDEDRSTPPSGVLHLRR